VHPEQKAKPTFTPKVGCFAPLSNLLHRTGSRALSSRRRSAVTYLGRRATSQGRRVRHAFPFAVMLVFVAVALLPAAAQAKQARLLAGTFGGAANPAPFPANPYPLETATAVAVDEATHDVYVADTGRARVEKFDAAGHFILMFGKGVNKTKVEEAGSTEAERNVCTAASGDECQVGESSFPPMSPLEEPRYLAVDNSSGPSAGDVYVSINGEETASGLVDKFDSSGQLVTGWASGGQLDGAAVLSPPAPVAGPFGRMHGIAVDRAGDLWVDAGEKMFEFRQDASFVGGWEPADADFGIAVDSETNLYLTAGEGEDGVTKYDSAGKETGLVAPSKSEVDEHGAFGVFATQGLAIDPSSDELFLDGREGTKSGERGIIKRYDSSCHPVVTSEVPQPGCEPAESFGEGLISTFPLGLAIDSSTKDLYVAESNRVAVFAFLDVPDVLTAQPTDPTHTSATLNGTVNPAGAELNPGTVGCRFEWGLTAAPYEHTAPCDKSAAQIGAGFTPVEVHAAIAGLEAGKTYHYRLVASNANDVNESIDEPSLGSDLAFGPSLIESASSVGVTASSATLQALVDPNNLDTHVRLEYGVEAGVYDQSTEEVDIGSAGTGQVADFQLLGLTAATTYHYRVVAENVLGEGLEATFGPDQTFTTQSVTPLTLPDSRQWEMVSPPQKTGARIVAIPEGGLVQAAAGGGAVTYRAKSPTESEVQGFTNGEQILSVRGPDGWSSRSLGIPHVSPTGFAINATTEYKAFNPDLSLSVAHPFGEFDPAISPEASESTTYLRDLSSSCGETCFRPLVTAKPGFENVPPGTIFGQEQECTSGIGQKSNVECGPTFEGATPDLSHIILASQAPLVGGAGEHQLYEWTDGRLSQISVLPEGGQAPASATAGLQGGRRGISGDGGSVAWSAAVVGGGTRLYLRANADASPSASGACEEPGQACTLQLDAPACGGCKGGNGRFQFMSADGTRVFFTDSSRLTADSGASPTPGDNKADLYECRIVEADGELTCALTDLTPANGGEGAAVQGSILGAAEDGSSVYFVAEGVLASNQVDNGSGPETAVSGRPNLYVSRDGVTTFLTRLAEGDSNDWTERLAHQPTEVSSDGRWLELMSERSLTGYDNRDISSEKPVAEVYLFHSAEGGGGTLRCASCDPTGIRPQGIEYSKLEPSDHGLVGGPGGIWPSAALVGANVPGWPLIGTVNAEQSPYQPRYLSGSGRLFFDTVNGLVPQDSNGTQDVYEYEPPGIGDCTEASSTFSSASGGCVGLISSGTSREESAFIDASESGDDVFFVTSSRLAPQDVDTSVDVYDAHVCSAAVPCLPAPPPSPPVCEGDGCQTPATPPVDPTPGSLTFSGAGNLLECATGKVLKGGKCVKKQQKKTKKHKKKHHTKTKNKNGRKSKKSKRANTDHGGNR
jgi:hypothetical protein